MTNHIGYIKNLKQKSGSTNTHASKRSLVSQIIKVHDSISEQYLLVLISFYRELYSKFISPRKALRKAPVVNVHYSADL